MESLFSYKDWRVQALRGRWSGTACGCLKKRMNGRSNEGVLYCTNKQKTIMRCYTPSTSPASFQKNRNGEDEGRGMTVWAVRPVKTMFTQQTHFRLNFKHMVHLLRSERFFLYFFLRMDGPPLTYRLLAKIPRVTLGGPNKGGQDVNNHANGSLAIFPDFTRQLNFTGLLQAATCTDAKFPNCSKTCNGGFSQPR